MWIQTLSLGGHSRGKLPMFDSGLRKADLKVFSVEWNRGAGGDCVCLHSSITIIMSWIRVTSLKSAEETCFAACITLLWAHFTEVEAWFANVSSWSFLSSLEIMSFSFHISDSTLNHLSTIFKAVHTWQSLILWFKFLLILTFYCPSTSSSFPGLVINIPLLRRHALNFLIVI